MVVGIKEEFIPIKSSRERKDREAVEQVTETIQEDSELVGETEEVFRLGKYEEGAQRPIKIRFKSQSAAEAVVGKAWRQCTTSNRIHRENNMKKRRKEETEG